MIKKSMKFWWIYDKSVSDDIWSLTQKSDKFLKTYLSYEVNFLQERAAVLNPVFVVLKFLSVFWWFLVGASHTTEELIEKKSKPREILHINTRFKNDPFNPKASQSQIQQAAQQQQQNLVGKIGVDGREVMPQETPKVGGYGMLATPSPAPGKCTRKLTGEGPSLSIILMA